MISHCGFDLHFPSDNTVEHLHIQLLAISVYFGENVYSVPLPVFNWVI